jgi:hypothetical protein
MEEDERASRLVRRIPCGVSDRIQVHRPVISDG